MGLTFGLVYLVVGIGFSEMANLGHKRRYKKPISPWLYLTGVFFWPFMLAYRRT